jgi:UDP-arabinose 4-epimerase
MPETKDAKPILVTGGAGYIGSHACKALAEAGYLPVTYDNLDRGHEWAVKWGPLELGNVRDAQRLAQAFDRYKPSAVLHFAGFTYVGESVLQPDLYYENNVAGTLTLLGAMKKAGIGRLVFSSSAAVYGVPRYMPLDEDHPLDPISPYGRSKLFIERVLEDYSRFSGLRSISLRYFNAAGADLECETGEAHDPETHLIPLALAAVREPARGLTLFGDDYDTRDGTCVRDYIHVTDLAAAHVLALKALESGAQTGAYNLGVGEGHSVREVLDAVERVTGKAPLTDIGPRREGDPPTLISTSHRAEEILGWIPRHSDLDTMVSTAWRWMNRHSAGA